jgi:hypothetical protein
MYTHNPVRVTIDILNINCDYIETIHSTINSTPTDVYQLFQGRALIFGHPDHINALRLSAEVGLFSNQPDKSVQEQLDDILKKKVILCTVPNNDTIVIRHMTTLWNHLSGANFVAVIQNIE